MFLFTNQKMKISTSVTMFFDTTIYQLKRRRRRLHHISNFEAINFTMNFIDTRLYTEKNHFHNL